MVLNFTEFCQYMAQIKVW